MGLHERTNAQSNFLAVKHGALCLESNEPKDGYDQVTVHNPSTDSDVTKYVKRYAALDGMISKLEWYDRESNGVRYVGLKIHIKDEGEYFQLDLPANKRHYDYFTKVMENIDYEKRVEFHAWKDKQDPRSTAFAIKQDEKFVPWKYTKDDMGDCPLPKKDVMGKWDFRDQKLWLYERLHQVVIPHVNALNAFDEPMPEYTNDDDPPALAQAKAVAAKSVTPVREEYDSIPF